MPRPPASAYRFDPDTLADIDQLADRLRTSATGVIREAVRRLAEAELPRKTGAKKIPNKSRNGIDTGNTKV